MKKTSLLIGFILGAVLFTSSAVYAVSTFIVQQGGTGVNTITAGQLVYGDGTNPIASVATTSVSCSGSASCTPFVAIGSSPVTISATGSGSNTDPNWNFLQATGGNYLTPTTTTAGIVVSASSTVGNSTQTGGLTVNGGATTTKIQIVQGGFIVGTTSTLDNNTYATFRELGTSQNIDFDTSGGQKLFSIANTNTDAVGSGGFTIYRNGTDNGSLISANTGLFFNSDSVSNHIDFAANGTTEYRLQSSGNSSFGLSNTNGALLTIEGSTTPWTENLFTVASTTGTGFLTINANGTTTLGFFGACNTNSALVTDSSGNITCGILSGAGSGYPFPVATNSTSTLTGFNGGLTAYASSTIGNGTTGGGLTISGNATSTGSLNIKTASFSTLASLDVAATGGGINYPLLLENNNANGTQQDTGILFRVQGIETNRGKGALIYDSQSASTFNRGDFEFLQNSVGDTSNPTFPANAVMTIANSGKVGIGSTTPAAQLSIANPSLSTTPVFTVSTSTATATTTAFIIDQNGKVGIGTGVPSQALEIDSGGELIQGASSWSGGVIAKLSLGDSNTFVSNTNGGNGIFSSNNSITMTTTAGSGIAKVSTPSNNFQVVEGGGGVAYFEMTRSANNTGTANLQVDGTFSASSAMNANIKSKPTINQSGTASYAALQLIPTETTLGSGMSYIIQSGTSTNTDLFDVTNKGYVGIGTSSPAAELSVGAQFGFTYPNNLLFNIGSSTSGTATTSLFSIKNSGTVTMTSANSATDVLDINSPGGNRIAINGFGYINAPALSTSFNSYFDGGQNFILNFSGNTNIGSDNNKNIRIFPQGTGITSVTNNFGVGTTSPFARVSIQANPNDPVFSSTLFAVGSSTATATTTLFSVSNIGSTTIGNFGTCSGTSALTTTSFGTIVCGTLTAGTPAPNNTDVQYNNSGAFGASDNFQYSSNTEFLNSAATSQVLLNARFSGTSVAVVGYDSSKNGQLLLFDNASAQNITLNSSTGSTFTRTSGSGTVLTSTANASGLPVALVAQDGGFANTSDIATLSQINGTDSGTVLHITNAGSGPSIYVQQGNSGFGTSTPTANFVSVGASTTPGTVQTGYKGVVAIITGLENTVTKLFFEIDQWGHQITSGDAPNISGGTSSVSGNDNNGTITVTGTALTSVTLTFAHAWPTAPDCTESDNSTALTADITSISTTQVVFGFSIGINSGTVWYRCTGHQ